MWEKRISNMIDLENSPLKCECFFFHKKLARNEDMFWYDAWIVLKKNINKIILSIEKIYTIFKKNYKLKRIYIPTNVITLFFR